MQRIADYPNLNNYVKEIYQLDGIRETVDLGHIKKHYTKKKYFMIPASSTCT